MLYKHLEGILSPDTALLAETGDSWFNCQKLRLPDGCRCRSRVCVCARVRKYRLEQVGEPCSCSLHCTSV